MSKALFTGQKKTKFRLALPLPLLRRSRPKFVRDCSKQHTRSSPNLLLLTRIHINQKLWCHNILTLFCHKSSSIKNKRKEINITQSKQTCQQSESVGYSYVKQILYNGIFVEHSTLWLESCTIQRCPVSGGLLGKFPTQAACRKFAKQCVLSFDVWHCDRADNALHVTTCKSLITFRRQQLKTTPTTFELCQPLSWLSSFYNLMKYLSDYVKCLGSILATVSL